MEAISLKQLFEQSKDELRNQLRGKKLPRDFQKIQEMLKATFLELLAGDNEVRLSLIDTDVKLLNSLIRIHLPSYDTSINESIDYVRLSKQKEKTWIPDWQFIIVQSINGRYAEKETDNSQPITEELINGIIGELETVCSEIDNILNRVKNNREEMKKHYEKLLQECTLDKMYPQLLSTLRYLWKENNNGESSNNKYVESLIADFENYGYKIVKLSPETRSYFSYKINPKVDSETMYLPAITKKTDGESKEIVVEKGIVYVPEQQNQ
ncbi:hypothetical protein C7Y71_007145 [Pseudoprevotella muciniphila]|uniref:Uncharacterized protein n=1 Tax=Pseudoprevotella muciniphila TaxID=2133944 RepID=A0A5P8E746_9BACT|nr:hypothetical protein [Pseudoprevotella muciniphila]QFQ12811.1 hypothetical protein C7Y71_007145 [Pseudoprevotella muciniphila]